MKTKICTRCNKEKPLSEFYKTKHNKVGVIAECKVCKRTYTMQRWQGIKSNPVLHEKEKERCRKNSRRWSLKEDYGLTIEDWNKLFKKQQGCCAICGKHQSEFEEVLCVDHRHSDDKVRGLLCRKCNMVLGLVDESNTIIQGMLEYVKKHKNI